MYPARSSRASEALPPRTAGAPPPRPSPVLWALIVTCCAVELTLMAADWGLVGTRQWRGLAYQYGAFWAGLLYNWQPNYAAQPWTMFLSYAFLHGGFWHLAGNMVTLLALGLPVERRAGRGGFLAIYLVSAVGGGAVFGLLAPGSQPMVGASGALFGLVGAWQYWEWRDRGRAGRSRAPVWRAVIWLAVLNAVLWLALGGLLAWQTHLGGFLAGWAAAAALALARRRG